LQDGERVVRLPYVEPEHFRVYIDWSYTGKLAVEDDATKADHGMNLANMFILGDVLDDVELRNSAARLLNAQVVAHGFFYPRVVRLIYENTASSSLLRKWTAEAAFLLLDRKYFAKHAVRYPADFMSELAVKALQQLSPIPSNRQERECQELLAHCLEPEGETSETAT
jgi:hypothetical protein